ncbi:hypothetical protein [Rodentibacter pneumotropicus]|uniref:hypothetical protein n=1 Tax=Rodentibacter pneumotropicus TaxID=758 RepID=UPI00109C9BF8|nr:hypothetical protein [Rodentibacter pneumotropicus]TGZ98880.1 hypothetical protein D3M79_07915 [Rodentibacter pneumotropicus]THA02125.1 hypothetical protein D3M74_04420 [Rodentibacter pneumotropicus]THA06737.1 hypothetical protein D3M77_07525 [Rodentibacter pneumotropicus]
MPNSCTGKLIQTHEGTLIYRNTEQEKKTNPSLLLIEELTAHFNVPTQPEERDLTDSLAFFGVCYLALIKELNGTPALKWLDNRLCDVYSQNGRYPLEQMLKKYAQCKAQQGGKNGN